VPGNGHPYRDHGLVVQLLPFGLAWAGAFGVVRRACGRQAPWRAGLLLALLLMAGDVLNGSSMLSTRAVRLVSGNPANSPGLKMLVGAYYERDSGGLRNLPATASTREMVDIEAWARANPQGSVLLVIVESMGWHAQPAMPAWLQARLAPPGVLAGYALRQGMVPFAGATTSGELRELCSLAGSYRAVTASAAAACLPNRLAALGWATVGYHGFSSHMFERDVWWPMVGLQAGHFAEGMVQEGDAECGAAFAGACDAAVLARAVRSARSARSLSYALTLNSHLPLKPAPLPADLAVLCAQAGADDEVCLLTATVGQALSALATELSHPSAVQPLVVVVGDHAPPFSAPAQRSQYSQTHVPAFVLTPRASAAAGATPPVGTGS
jgi:hypothetical protein